MKRFTAVLLALLWVCLLAGCQVAQLLNQAQGGEAASQESLPEVPPSAPQGGPSGEAPPVASAKPARGEAPTSSREPAPAESEGSVTDHIGMTYQQLADAYGPAEIYHWHELGLYSGFDAAQITVLFDFEMIYPYYSDVSQWLEDPGEFVYSDITGQAYSFETGRFTPWDFKVDVVSVWGDALEQLLEELGIEAPATLEILNDSFGQIRTAEEDLLYGWFEAGSYSRGDYQYRFVFDDDVRYVASAWVQPAGDGAYAADVRMLWCDGVELDDEIIWLREPTSHGGMDGGGGEACILAPPLTTLFRTSPPQEGELYSVSFSDDGMVMQLDLVQPPEEGDVFFVLWLYEEIEYLITQQGMTPLAEMERVFIDGQLCYTAALGTNHAGQLVRERHFAVDVENWLVYEYDVITDSYAPLGMG